MIETRSHDARSRDHGKISIGTRNQTRVKTMFERGPNNMKRIVGRRDSVRKKTVKDTREQRRQWAEQPMSAAGSHGHRGSAGAYYFEDVVDEAHGELCYNGYRGSSGIIAQYNIMKYNIGVNGVIFHHKRHDRERHEGDAPRGCVRH